MTNVLREGNLQRRLMNSNTLTTDVFVRAIASHRADKTLHQDVQFRMQPGNHFEGECPLLG